MIFCGHGNDHMNIFNSSLRFSLSKGIYAEGFGIQSMSILEQKLGLEVLPHYPREKLKVPTLLGIEDVIAVCEAVLWAALFLILHG